MCKVSSTYLFANNIFVFFSVTFCFYSPFTNVSSRESLFFLTSAVFECGQREKLTIFFKEWIKINFSKQNMLLISLCEQTSLKLPLFYYFIHLQIEVIYETQGCFQTRFFFTYFTDVYKNIITKCNKCFCWACQLFWEPACILEHEFCVWIIIMFFCLNCHVGIKKFSDLPRKSIHFFLLMSPMTVFG